MVIGKPAAAGSHMAALLHEAGSAAGHGGRGRLSRTVLKEEGGEDLPP